MGGEDLRPEETRKTGKQRGYIFVPNDERNLRYDFKDILTDTSET